MLFQIRHVAPKYFLLSFNGTPHPSVRLAVVQVFQTFSSCATTASYAVIYTCMQRMELFQAQPP